MAPSSPSCRFCYRRSSTPANPLIACLTCDRHFHPTCAHITPSQFARFETLPVVVLCSIRCRDGHASAIVALKEDLDAMRKAMHALNSRLVKMESSRSRRRHGSHGGGGGSTGDNSSHGLKCEACNYLYNGGPRPKTMFRP